MIQSRRTTIKQVAQQAGVSTQTISRVVNGRHDVAPETRKRVLQVIQELGYKPSALARSLIQRRSYTLGVVVSGLNYIGPSRTLNGITAQAEELGYTLILKELLRFDANDIHPLIQTLLAHQVDGVIWAVPGVGENRKWIHELDSLPVPFVFLAMQSQPDLTIISVDNYQGGKLATQHLLDLGYRHIGHISGPVDWWEARQRKQAWRDTLIQAGHELSDRQWVEGNWSASSGEQAINRLLAQYPEMDGVFVANDQMALSALQTACDRGIKVPQDLGVVGFDDIAESAYFCPALTTVRQDQQQVGCMAVREVIHAIEAMHEEDTLIKPETTVIQPEIVVRKSTSARQKGGG